MQRRLARLAKAQQPFNSLVAALAKASASAITLVESEKLRQLPRLGKTVFNINLESQDNPHAFQMQPPAAKRSLSVRGSLSTPQRPLSLQQVASDVPRREAALLWVVPRRTWPLSSIGCRLPPPECTPRLLISLGEPSLSAASPSPLLVLVLSTDSRSIVVEPRAEKHFQEASLIPSFAPGVPAAGRTADYQKTSAAAKSKPASSDPAANGPLGAEQLSSDEDETEWVGCDTIFEVCHRENSNFSQGGWPLRKTGGFISKPFGPSKKRSFRQECSGAKKRRSCLGHWTGSALRIQGYSSADGARLSRRLLKLLGKEPLKLKGFHWLPIRCRTGRHGLSKRPTENCIDRYRQQYTSTAAVDPALIVADNLPRMEQPCSDEDETGWVGCDAVFKIHHQEDCNLSQESQPLRKTGGFFRTSYRGHQKPLSQSLHSSMEEQHPTATTLLKTGDSVPEKASEIPFRWKGFDEERLVAIQRLTHYMVVARCSLMAAEAATGFSWPGYEGLYRASPPTVLNADSSANSHPIP